MRLARPSPWTLLAWAAGATGVALRLSGFGARAFWNDEAWVALTTRVQGWEQFQLAASVTPLGWAAALRLLSHLPGPPEVTLRLLPLGFSLATLWLAWRVGARVGGHAAGGVLACAVVAVDPLSVVYARTLKPYSAEACLALLACALAIRAADGARGALAALAVALTAGACFANAQLLVAPAVLGGLLVVLLVAGRRRAALAVAAAGAVVGLVDLALYRVLVAPRLLPSLDAFWAAGALAPSGPLDAVGAVARLLRAELVGVWGPMATGAALAALALAVVRRGPARLGAVALVLLVLALAVAALRRPIPGDAPRLFLFATTLAAVHGAGALGGLVGVPRRRRVAAVAALAVAVLAVGVAGRAPWRRVVWLEPREELGPLVRLVERTRGPDDAVLLYERSLFVWAYYQAPTPVLLPAPHLAVGYRPHLADRRIVVVRDGPAPALRRALAAHARVWLVGSRFRGRDEAAFREAASALGRVALQRAAPRALLLRVERAPRA